MLILRITKTKSPKIEEQPFSSIEAAQEKLDELKKFPPPTTRKMEIIELVEDEDGTEREEVVERTIIVNFSPDTDTKII